jgi:hypothetical protein
MQFTREELKIILQEIPDWLKDVEQEMRKEALDNYAVSKNDTFCQCWACRCIRGRRERWINRETGTPWNRMVSGYLPA